MAEQKHIFLNRKGFAFSALILALLLLVFTLLGLGQPRVQAANPTTMNFQGKVVNANGTNVTDGSYTFVFRLYQNVTVGTYNPNTLSCAADTNCYWEETDTVAVTSGVFQVNLGATCAFTSACNSGHSGIDFNTQNALSLTMKFNGDANGYMTPLISMQSVPYALNADKVGGVSASSIVQLGATQSGNINVTNGTFTGTLAVQGASALTLGTTTTNPGAIIFNTGGANTITLQGPTSNPGSAYVLKLPTTAPSLSQCLQNDGTTIGQLTFTACTTGNTLQTAYTNGATITLTQNSPVSIKDSASASSTNLFQVQNNGATTTFFGVSTAGINVAGTGVFKSAAGNSSTAFQVQNSAGTDIINIDTTDTNLATNPGFEQTAPLTWVAAATAAPTRDTSNSYLGFASGSVSATAAGDGFKETLASTLSAVPYTISWYAQQVSGTALTDMIAAYAPDGTTQSNCTNINSQSLGTGGWKRYWCQFTPVSPTAANAIFIKQVGAGTRVWNIDSVQVETGTVATAYGAGAIALNSNVISPINFKNAQDSINELQVTDSSNNNLLNVDSTGNNINNLVTNASFESGTTGWAAKNTATIAQTNQFTNGTYVYPQNGSSVLKVTTNTTATSDGAKFPVTMTNGTTYSILMYVKADAGTVSTFEIGHADNGSTDTSCLTAQKASSTGWTKLQCTFIAGAQSGSPYIYVRQTDNTTTARTFYADAVLMQTDANADANYRDGKISLQGSVINSAVQIQTDYNTTNAFQVQNSAGFQIFNISTTNNTNLITNAGFEVNATGWSLRGAATALSRTTSTSYSGIASGQFTITTAASGADGIKYSLPTSPTNLMTSGVTYALSFYAKLSSGTITTLVAGHADNGVSESNCTIAPTFSSLVVGGWTRFSCSFTAGAQSSTPYIYIGATATSGTSVINIDGVQLEVGSTASAHAAGVIQLNGIINSPATFQAGSNSTTAFQIQNSSGSSLFGIDTLNNFITLGSGTGTNATLLVLGTKTDTGDPGTCTLGAIYYNSSGAAETVFRACRNVKNMSTGVVTATWTNLVAGVDVQDFTANGTWTRPQGVSTVMVVMCGGGGGGAGGQTRAAAAAGGGGTGGGGGAHVERILTATDAGSTAAIVVGAVTGTAAAGASGSIGGPSSFGGTLVKAAGGGGGLAGSVTASAGGSGAGLVTNGSLGATAANSGGENSVGTAKAGFGWAGGGNGTGANGGAAEFGGAGGGGIAASAATSSNGFAGGDSIVGGTGGGAGGSTDTSNTNHSGGTGGGSGTYAAGSGTGTGGVAGTNNGIVGANGNSSHCGTGGGGGGSNGTAAAGNGANGGNAGGGGGGGGSGTTGGTGGTGGRGEVWVFSW